MVLDLFYSFILICSPNLNTQQRFIQRTNYEYIEKTEDHFVNDSSKYLRLVMMERGKESQRRKQENNKEL